MSEHSDQCSNLLHARSGLWSAVTYRLLMWWSMSRQKWTDLWLSLCFLTLSFCSQTPKKEFVKMSYVIKRCLSQRLMHVDCLSLMPHWSSTSPVFLPLMLLWSFNLSFYKDTPIFFLLVFYVFSLTLLLNHVAQWTNFYCKINVGIVKF